MGELARVVQEVTGQSVELAFVDQGYTGDVLAQKAKAHGIQLEVIKLPQAKRGFVLLPRRWVWNAPLPGWHAFGGWLAIMSGFLLPLQVFISSPLLVSCLANGSLSCEVGDQRCDPHGLEETRWLSRGRIDHTSYLAI